MNDPNTPTPAELRALLAATLRDASVFDAFCHDHFPVVFARFPNAMDRTARETLLLQNVDPDTLHAALVRVSPRSASSRSAPTPTRAATPLTDGQLLDALTTLLPAEFDLVVAALGVPVAVLSSAQSAQATRSAELVRWVAARGRGADLERALATHRPPSNRPLPEARSSTTTTPSREPVATEERRVDFLIITALEEERDAVLAQLPGARKLDRDGRGAHTWYEANVETTRADRSVYRVIVTSLSGMGPIQGAIKAGAVIQRWNPAHVLMVGIAGGLAGEVGLGDVMVATQVADYTVGKVVDGKPRQERWFVYPADADLFDAANNFPNGWQSLVKHKRPTDGAPKRHAGVVASGGDVVASKDQIAVYLADWPKLIGVEMEGGGVAAGLHDDIARPRFLMIRGVSDLANAEGNTETKALWRGYACDVAAAYAVGLLRDGPVPGKPA